MAELTKEWLQQTIAELEEERDATPGAVNEDAALALAAMKLALASIEVEPVAWTDEQELRDVEKYGCGYLFTANPITPNADPHRVIKLYTAPPAPVSVPDEVMSAIEHLKQTLVNCNRYNYCSDAVKRIDNAVRAAMLQGSENAESPTTMQTAPSLDSSQIIAESPSGNSPVIPDCSCGTCRPVTFTDSRFVVCSECGNKRCPHANDHHNACTGSNEPGQEGSAYPAAPRQEVK